MDFSILYAIQGMRSPVLDSFILALTGLMGSYGQIWLVVGAALGVALALATVKLQRLALAGMKKRREAHRE